MNKKILFICLFLCACIVSVVSCSTEEKAKSLIKPVNLDESILIGSEFPRLIYADEDRVIFHAFGVFIYDIQNKVISDSLDVWSFGQNLITASDKKSIFNWSFVTQEGNEIIIAYYNETEYKSDFITAFAYTINSQTLLELSKEAYDERRSNIFECKHLESDDSKYPNSTEMVAYINETEYVYLNVSPELSGYINIVYVGDEVENIYPAVSLSRTYELLNLRQGN